MPAHSAPDLPETISRYLGAMQRHDIPAMLACLSLDVHVTRIAHGAVIAEAYGKTECEALAREDTGEWEVLSTRTVGSATLADIALVHRKAAGVESRCRGAVSFRQRGGLITRLVEEV